jgi:SpoVK/Ycf46/Vps4 family AAA+-type ATPase
LKTADVLSSQSQDCVPLRKAFDDAIRKAPSILFIEDIDVIAPKEQKGATSTPSERQLLPMLLYPPSFL